MRAKKEHILKIVITVIMVLLGICCIYPFVFMLSSSFKPSGDVLSTPLQIIPKNFTLMNFKTLFKNEFYDFFRWFGNTVVMTGLTLILKFFIITITAYGFAKIKFPGRDAIFLVLLAGLMIPSDIMIMPRYIIFKELHILNTMWSLILPAAVDVYFVFLLRQAFVAVPEALSEAARIDGCNHFTIYRRIILPLCMPQVATMLLFSFVWSWNDYMSPYLYISDINKQMISVGIKLLASGLAQDYGAQMAGATLVLVPVIIAFFLCQKYFVEGITAGAVKG
ncbi:carbohydrate ABC transporter permease [Faecalibacterium sp. An122]|uniref:carbohydrate ABC transporter permease n=1 Tax=Faecalibacterium sp. An122 TaxID=1965551 RepID=UPI000B3A5E06|nr:carbohydrate ABC transporter permease [Faecalibacterium sp. An122]OUQ36954.1 sugar ABC transporter permease [Faecalibacterium sp. An122]